MDGSTANDGSLILGPVPIAVYAAMLGATLAGQLGGIALEAGLGSHGVWIPATCSVALESLVGARLGAARIRRALTPRECVRLSAYYSAGLTAISVPLAVWTAAAGARALEGPGVRWALTWVAAIALVTAARAGLLVLLSRGRR